MENNKMAENIKLNGKVKEEYKRVFLEGIPVIRKYYEYSEEQLKKMPPIPNYKKGVDYPDYYEDMPLIWNGYEWELIFE